MAAEKTNNQLQILLGQIQDQITKGRLGQRGQVDQKGQTYDFGQFFKTFSGTGQDNKTQRIPEVLTTVGQFLNPCRDADCFVDWQKCYDHCWRNGIYQTWLEKFLYSPPANEVLLFQDEKGEIISATNDNSKIIMWEFTNKNGDRLIHLFTDFEDKKIVGIEELQQKVFDVVGNDFIIFRAIDPKFEIIRDIVGLKFVGTKDKTTGKITPYKFAAYHHGGRTFSFVQYLNPKLGPINFGNWTIPAL